MSFCATIEHELLHCAQAVDDYGSPKFTREGKPKFAIKGHDVEEFVDVVTRYGVSASSVGVKALVEAAKQKPLFNAPSISSVCGNCLG
jgi:hypothetical protein